MYQMLFSTHSFKVLYFQIFFRSFLLNAETSVAWVFADCPSFGNSMCEKKWTLTLGALRPLTCIFQVTLSTSPSSESTHWKQTVFYLGEKVRAKRGQQLQGRIEVSRPKEDARALKVAITLDRRRREYVME